MTQKSFGLIGCPLGHSMSPFLQGRLFSAAGVQAEYRLFELAPGTLASALPALRELDGFNITIPYKSEIIPFLDEVDGTAAFFGSVNTVKNENGRLIGCSTDGEGFLFALGACGVRVDGARVLLLGYGGASRAMGGTALLSGAKSILIAGRSPERAAQRPRPPVRSCRRAPLRAGNVACRRELGSARERHARGHAPQPGPEPRAGGRRAPLRRRVRRRLQPG